MARTNPKILLTGFGPFPGASFNPTGPLVEALARLRHPASREVQRATHVFPTAYQAVDDQLPVLLAREHPDILLMFGLAQRSPHVRIETRAHNHLTGVVADVDGRTPQSATIRADTSGTLPLTAPAHRLAWAARATGFPAVVSHDAGRYLCNYLCWRACELTAQGGGPRLVTFVHVPRVQPGGGWRVGLARSPFTFGDLLRAGEAIMLAAIREARSHR